MKEPVEPTPALPPEAPRAESPDPGPRTPDPGPSRNRWRRGALVLGLAVAFGLLESLQGRVLYPHVPWHKYMPEALIRTMPCWLMLAALWPVMVWMSRRARVDRSTWPVALPVQVVAGVAFVLVHMGTLAWAIALIRNRPDRTFTDIFFSIFSKYAVMDFFTYCGIVAVLHAVHYQSEARSRAVAASRLQAGLARARLQALRAQLDPHFLFNALHSISVLALQGKRESVVQTVSYLADVLRMSLDDSGSQEVALAAELELLDHYLEIERVRFGDRLNVERRIDPKTLAARVPSLLLQPLVENAVRHGVAKRRGPGRILIEAGLRQGMLFLEVRDSGPGFPPPPHREGIGLGNTRARLQQIHGKGQLLEIGRAAEGGARVTVMLPFLPGQPAPGEAPA